MLIKIQPTILLQTVREYMANFKVILKSIKGTDDNCIQGGVQAWMGF